MGDSVRLQHGNHGRPTLVNFELSGPLPKAIKWLNANALNLKPIRRRAPDEKVGRRRRSVRAGG